MNREIFLDGVDEIVCDYVCDSYRTEKIAKEISIRIIDMMVKEK